MTTDIARLTATLADRYVIKRELGAGGMATVYLAHDIKHDRDVAIKVLRPELAAVIGAERFLAEIKTTANLQHPHILPLFDSGEADGLLFYVMPFVEGISLRDRLTREKQLPVADAVRIATEVAAALDYAHRHGVIHRDIKPENILLHDGSALVADFGIALAASKAGARMTETGMSFGTPQYMSPEQAMGERELDARSDVYALGCVTYEMLIGEPPFTGPTAQAIIARLMTEEPRRLTLQRKTVPLEVEGAVLQAIDKLPADRFATAAQFSDALLGRSLTVTTREGAGRDRRQGVADALLRGERRRGVRHSSRRVGLHARAWHPRPRGEALHVARRQRADADRAARRAAAGALARRVAPRLFGRHAVSHLGQTARRARRRAARRHRGRKLAHVLSGRPVDRLCGRRPLEEGARQWRREHHDRRFRRAGIWRSVAR